MKFSELPIGTVVKNKHGVFKKLADNKRTKAGRAEVMTRDLLPTNFVVVFAKSQIVEVIKLPRRWKGN